MSKPYDSATKQLLEAYPLDWLRLLDLPIGEVEIIDADLSTIQAEADKLIRVNAEQPYIAHIEMQASYKPDMAERFMVYNILAGYRTGLPVHTCVFLLRPEADGTVMRQPIVKRVAGREPYQRFQFQVERLWEEPVERYLEGGLGAAPLAPLCARRVSELPQIVHRMEERIRAESDDAATLLSAAYVLMGLRYKEEITDRFLRGVRDMEESATYQAILRKGEAKGKIEGEARGKLEGELSALLILGGKRLGKPRAKTLKTLHAITSAEAMERLVGRLLEVETWSELLAAL